MGTLEALQQLLLQREVLFTASKEGEEETGGGQAALGQTPTHASEAEKIYLAEEEM